MNYLQLNDYKKFAVEEQKLANYFGNGNYIPFYKKHLIQNKIKLTDDDFIAGELSTMNFAIKKLGIEYHHEDYPKELNKFLHRNIWETKLGYIKNKLFNDYISKPIFIKPKDKVKKFTGFVLESIDNFYLTGNSGDNTTIICSDVVKWVTEYRIPVINNIPCAYCNYYGDESIDVDKSIINEMIKSWTSAPKAYCLDAGVLDTGETALIEINDAFSCGSYNMSDEIYAKLLITRWNELKMKKEKQ